MLQTLLMQQQASQNNLCKLGGMVQNINQRLSSPPFTVAASSQEPNVRPNSVSNSTSQQLLVKPSEFFSGDATRCGGFLLQCQLSFRGAPQLYSTSISKISYFVSQLTGDTLQWVTSFLLTHDLDSMP